MSPLSAEQMNCEQCGHRTVSTVGSKIDGRWYCYNCAEAKRQVPVSSNEQVEQAFGVLQTLGIPRERARSVPNGIIVLDQRYAREVAALHAEIDRLTAERRAYRTLAGIGLTGTDEADELAKLEPMECEREAYRRIQERGLAQMRAAADEVRRAHETIGEPDAWMTDDGRICTSQSKSSQSPGKTREFTIPLYRHPRPWSEVEKAALGPTGVPTSELVVALHKRCNDQSRELARLNAKLAECTAVKTVEQSAESPLTSDVGVPMDKREHQPPDICEHGIPRRFCTAVHGSES